MKAETFYDFQQTGLFEWHHSCYTYTRLNFTAINVCNAKVIENKGIRQINLYNGCTLGNHTGATQGVCQQEEMDSVRDNNLNPADI